MITETTHETGSLGVLPLPPDAWTGEHLMSGLTAFIDNMKPGEAVNPGINSAFHLSKSLKIFTKL